MLIKKVSNINKYESEVRPDESCDDSDTSSDNESSTNMEGGDAKIETNNAVQYHQVYKTPIKPWATESDDGGNCTRKTFYKY